MDGSSSLCFVGFQGGKNHVSGFNRYIFVLPLFVLILMLGAASQSAADEPSAEELAKANNPLADTKAFNIQDYYIPELYDLDNAVANTFWMRLAIPTGPVLWRASLPLKTVPTMPTSTGGVGDFELFAAYLAVNKPTFTFGVGPQLVMPTASKDELGTGKWQLGVAAIAFASSSPKVQVGGLVIWQTSIGGDDERNDVSILATQPFGFWQLGGGKYLRTAPIWFFDLESGHYSIPFGFGVGQVVKVGETVFNIFIEPQFTVLHYGAGQPAFQVYTALNMQFK